MNGLISTLMNEITQISGLLRGTNQQGIFSFFVKQVLWQAVPCKYSKERKNVLDEKGASNVQQQTTGIQINCDFKD